MSLQNLKNQPTTPKTRRLKFNEMTEIELIDWQEKARRDDLFKHLVPSDVRYFIGEILRLRKVIELLDSENLRHDMDTNNKIIQMWNYFNIK